MEQDDNASPVQGSAPNHDSVSESPLSVTPKEQKSNKNLLIIGVVLLVLLVGLIAVLLLTQQKAPSPRHDENTQIQSDEETERGQENEFIETNESDSENNSTQQNTTTTGSQNVAHLGELECEYRDGELYQCVIPPERVLNRPQNRNLKYTLVYPNDDGSFDLKTHSSGIGAISKTSNNTYTVTVSNPNSYIRGEINNPQSSVELTFDKEVISMGIGGYGNAQGEEHAFFVTSDGSVHYIKFEDIVKGQTTVKK